MVRDYVISIMSDWLVSKMLACCVGRRFILHNTVGDGQFTSLLDDISHEVTRLRPSLLVVGGLRMMLGVDSGQGWN